MMQVMGALLFPAAGISAILPPRRRPRRLRRGDVVGLVEPAYFTPDAFDLELVLDTIRAMGLIPRPAPNILSRYGYLAGRDEERAAHLNAMYADPEVRAIFAVRGGWGCARILPHLDFDLIRANPKLLTGFSDITALHLALAARTDCPTIHGPNAASAWGRLSWDSFRSLAFDAETPTWRNPAGTEDRLAQRNGRIRTFRPGRASGPLLGGNLTVLTSLVGTPYLPDFDGAILFLEDTEEAQYRIDRMLTQLALAGIPRPRGGHGLRPMHRLHRAELVLDRRLHPLRGARPASDAARRARLPRGPVRPCAGAVQHPRRRPRGDRRDGGDDPDAGASGRLERSCDCCDGLR